MNVVRIVGHQVFHPSDIPEGCRLSDSSFMLLQVHEGGVWVRTDGLVTLRFDHERVPAATSIHLLLTMTVKDTASHICEHLLFRILVHIWTLLEALTDGLWPFDHVLFDELWAVKIASQIRNVLMASCEVFVRFRACICVVEKVWKLALSLHILILFLGGYQINRERLDITMVLLL